MSPQESPRPLAGQVRAWATDSIIVQSGKIVTPAHGRSDREKTIALPLFGPCTYRESDTLTFPWGLPGFESLRRFIAIQFAAHGNFVWLQSLDDPAVAIPTADPWQLFDVYAPVLPQYASASLDIQSSEDFAALCVVMLNRDAADDATVNLLAPVVINLRTRIGRQVILETGGYSVRTAIPRRRRAAAAGA
jgi:flagellar assembly factor FliW